MKFKILLITIFTVVNIHHISGANIRIDPLVLIDQGLVKGFKASDGDYSAFLGVPYAQVDANNPFGAALPSPKFNEEVFEAHDGSTMCPQSREFAKALRNGEEIDCLKLNIFVPNSASSRNPLPVLIWIHGGAFEIGHAGDYNPRNIVKNDVVVVVINYRLGPYGFICLDSPNAPGNQGLKDQNAALRWVRNNIAAFGGNPYKVTIGGQSAGAASTLFHLYSDKEKLYNQVIAQSGTPQTEGLFVEGDKGAAIKLAQHLGYNATETESALQFLSSTSPDLVIGAARDLNLFMRPCKEKSFGGIESFVETGPFSLSNPKKIQNTPVLIGHTNAEQGLFLEYDDKYFQKDPFYEKIKQNFNLEESQLDEAVEAVKHFYIGDETLSEDVVRELEHFESDFIFNHPTQRSVSRLIEENASPIYEYLFSYVGDSGLDGAVHSAELPFIFAEDTKPALGSDDDLVSERITTLWSNFIKFGNPTPAVTDLLPVTWPAVTKASRTYLEINNNLRIDSRVFHERMAFWDLFISAYGKYNTLARECLLD